MGGFRNQLIHPTNAVYATSYPKHVTLERQQFTPIDRHVGTNRCVLPWAFLYSSTLQPEPLQAALAQTLNQFPTLSARVHPVAASSRLGCCHSGSSADIPVTSRPAREPDWELLLCNAGVPFSVYSSTCSLQELLENGCMNRRQGFTFPDNGSKACLPAYMEPLDPVSVLSGAAPVVAVRLTQLAGGGSILAVTAAHVVLDGRSYVTFLKAWASQYNVLTAAQATAIGPAPAAASTSSAANVQPSNSSVLFSKQVLNDIAAGPDTASYQPGAAAAAASALDRGSSRHHTKAATGIADLVAGQGTKTPTPDPSSPAPASSGSVYLSGLHQPLSPRNSLVTIITNCASQHPSSTTAEAPDASSLQLSTSGSSTASTALSALSGHCQQPWSTVVAPGIQLAGRRHSLDTEAPVPVPPAAVAVPSTAADGSATEKQPRLQAKEPAVVAPAAGDAVGIQAGHMQQSDGLTDSQVFDQHPDGHALHQQSILAQPCPQKQQQQEYQHSILQVGMQQINGPKPMTDVDDPLHATMVPPPGWLPALRAVRAAHQQIKAEHGHIKRAFKESVMPSAVGAKGSSSSSSSNNNSSVSSKNGPKSVSAAASVKGFFAAQALPVMNLKILSTGLLCIPGPAVQRLKVAVSQCLSDKQYVSSNDVLSSLVWVLMCYLRKRPLPGQTRPPDMQDTYFGVALDLRTAAVAPIHSASMPESNITPADSHSRPQAAQQQQARQAAVPGNYFGSAAWSISVRSCNQDSHLRLDEHLVLPVSWHQSLNPREWEILYSDEAVLVKSLAAGAVRIPEPLSQTKGINRHDSKGGPCQKQ